MAENRTSGVWNPCCMPINKNVKDIIYNNKINYNNWRYKSDRDYSNFDFSKLYANNFQDCLFFYAQNEDI